MTDKNHPEATPENDSSSGDPASFRDTLNESARLLSANRPGEAAALLEPLQKQFPGDPDIAINLGGAFILQRRWKKAVRTLEKAVEATPDNVMLWTNLAAAYLGRLETSGPEHQRNAVRAYESALRIDPNAPNIHYHLGLIYKEQGNLSRASAMFQRALEVNPNDRDARYWMEKLSALLVEEQRQRSADESGSSAAEEAPEKADDTADTSADTSADDGADG